MLLGVFAVLVFLDLRYTPRGAEGLWLLPLVVLLVFGTAWEMTGLLLAVGRPVDRSATLAGSLVVTLSAAVPLLWPLAGHGYPEDCPLGRLGWIVIGGTAAILLVVGRVMVRFRGEADGVIERLTGGVFVSLCVGLPMGLLVALRGLGEGGWGLAAVLTTVLVTKGADTGAYFIGRAVGRRKLVPRLSPGKTWEGAIGGIAAATLAAWICLQWLFPAVLSGAGSAVAAGDAVGAGMAEQLGRGPALWWAIVLGPALALAGMIGDLAESLVKRSTGVKDSGDWLPGLGGMWDVTDSLIAAVAPAFLCFAAAV